MKIKVETTNGKIAEFESPRVTSKVEENGLLYIALQDGEGNVNRRLRFAPGAWVMTGDAP
ncbi:hypothetical protein J3R03_007159 [Actinoplanes couchii]|nr:hypothetical protein [Actinoplanes couchii]